MGKSAPNGGFMRSTIGPGLLLDRLMEIMQGGGAPFVSCENAKLLCNSNFTIVYGRYIMIY